MSQAMNTAATTAALTAAITGMVNDKNGDRELVREVVEDTVNIITNGTDKLPGFDLVAREDNDKIEAAKTAGVEWVEAGTRIVGGDLNAAVVAAMGKIDAAFEDADNAGQAENA